MTTTAVSPVAACQALVDRARQTTGSRIVQITRLNRATGLVESLAWSGFDVGLAAVAIQTVRRLFPEFDPFRVTPSAAINAANQRLYARGEVVLAPFDEVALNAVDHRILALAIGVAQIRESYMHPLRIDGQVRGALGFHAKAFSDEQLRSAQSFVPQAEEVLAKALLA